MLMITHDSKEIYLQATKLVDDRFTHKRNGMSNLTNVLTVGFDQREHKRSVSQIQEVTNKEGKRRVELLDEFHVFCVTIQSND